MTDALLPGAGFAWHAQRILNPWWVINVARYGAFLFEGNEPAAEEARAHKARWEGAIALKRAASFGDFAKPSLCWNHRGFLNARIYDVRGRRLTRPYRPRYICDCGECSV